MSTDDEARALRAAERELLGATNQLRAMRGYPPLNELPEPPFCSFCGRAKSEVGVLVEGLDAYICQDCAAEAQRLLLRGE